MGFWPGQLHHNNHLVLATTAAP